MILGKIQPAAATAFIADNPEATLGSLSADGMRRVNGPESLRAAFEQAGGQLAVAVATKTVTPGECEPCNKAKKNQPAESITPMESICQHRGSQRRAPCCNGVKLDRWICRLLKQKDGTTPMDCVLTDIASQNHLEHAPSAEAAEWRERVAVCSNCPSFTALSPGMAGHD